MRERDGQRMYEIDGYFRPHLESKSPEYRRTTIADLTEDQARTLYEVIGDRLPEKSTAQYFYRLRRSRGVPIPNRN